MQNNTDTETDIEHVEHEPETDNEFAMKKWTEDL